MKKNKYRYLPILWELKGTLMETSNISMKDFCRENQVNNSLGTYLKRLGVIKSVKNGRTPQWFWIGEEPSEELAIKVKSEINKNSKSKKTLHDFFPVEKNPVSDKYIKIQNQFKHFSIDDENDMRFLINEIFGLLSLGSIDNQADFINTLKESVLQSKLYEYKSLQSKIHKIRDSLKSLGYEHYM